MCVKLGINIAKYINKRYRSVDNVLDILKKNTAQYCERIR